MGELGVKPRASAQMGTGTTPHLLLCAGLSLGPPERHLLSVCSEPWTIQKSRGGCRQAGEAANQ